MTTIHRPRLLATAAVAVLLGSSLGAGAATAHGPDPALSGGGFSQNQVLRYRWRSGSEPAAVIKTAIKAAAGDANDSRASKAATFTYDAGGASPIGYGAGRPAASTASRASRATSRTTSRCGSGSRAMSSTGGRCAGARRTTRPPNGCYEAENIALDEFGHVEGLGHHDNYDSDSDYADAVVQTYSRTKPQEGWNKHVFGRCDVARLQIIYDLVRQRTSTRHASTCRRS